MEGTLACLEKLTLHIKYPLEWGIKWPDRLRSNYVKLLGIRFPNQEHSHVRASEVCELWAVRLVA